MRAYYLGRSLSNTLAFSYTTVFCRKKNWCQQSVQALLCPFLYCLYPQTYRKMNLWIPTCRVKGPAKETHPDPETRAKRLKKASEWNTLWPWKQSTHYPWPTEHETNQSLSRNSGSRHPNPYKPMLRQLYSTWQPVNYQNTWPFRLKGNKGNRK